MKNSTKSKCKSHLAIAALSAVFAVSTMGCNVTFVSGTFEKDKDVDLGTNPYHYSDDIITPYSVSEGYNEYGYPFTSYRYKGSDIDEDLICHFNNKSSKNVELIIDGNIEDVDFKVKNARLVTDYISGKSDVEINVPSNVEGQATYPYDYVPVFECDAYDDLNVIATAGTTVRLGTNYYPIQ